MPRTVTLYDDRSGYRQWHRRAIPDPHWTGRVQISTGIRLLSLHSGRRSGRRVACIDSQWMDPNGYTPEPHYTLLDESTYLAYCERVGCEPAHVEAPDLDAERDE